MAKRDKMIFFENLREVRKSKNITLTKLAATLRISHAQLIRIEYQRGGTPKKRALAIAKALKCRLRDLAPYTLAKTPIYTGTLSKY